MTKENSILIENSTHVYGCASISAAGYFGSLCLCLRVPTELVLLVIGTVQLQLSSLTLPDLVAEK